MTKNFPHCLRKLRLTCDAELHDILLATAPGGGIKTQFLAFFGLVMVFSGHLLG